MIALLLCGAFSGGMTYLLTANALVSLAVGAIAAIFSCVIILDND